MPQVNGKYEEYRFKLDEISLRGEKLRNIAALAANQVHAEKPARGGGKRKEMAK